jgi:integrase
MTSLTDKEIYDNINTNDNLSLLSKKSYINCIKRLIAFKLYKTCNLIELKKEGKEINITKNKTIFDIIKSPTKYIPELEKKIIQVRTYTATIGFILTIIKIFELSEEKYALLWKKEYKSKMDNVKDKRMTGIVEENKKGYIKWCDVLKKFSELKGNEKLILAIYILIPPRRLKDYYRVKLEKNEEDSYIDLTVKTPYILIKEYKTASTYGKWHKDLPKELLEIIQDSIKDNPRDYLFVSKKGTEFEYGDKGINSFTKQVNRDLQLIFKEPVTVNNLRHAYATHQIDRYKKNEITIKELNQGALDMGHNLIQQLLYEEREK